MALLDINDLSVSFRTPQGEVAIVENLDLSVERGRIVGLVGESGCGKSVTARAVMGILPCPPARIEARAIRFDGRDLLTLGEREMRAVRGGDVGMIFQEPMTSLNPTYTIGTQIRETLKLHTSLGRAEIRTRMMEMLQLVGIAAPERRADQYPFELSGGLRQRAMIAMALACDPKLLIADEPTTALDVTVQAQILDLLLSLRDRLDMSILLITHDLGVVAEVCDEVAVMYAGRIVEQAAVADLFKAPRHPYTAGLLASMPRVDGKSGVLPSIPGIVPAPGNRPVGCTFGPRCDRVQTRCGHEQPALAVAGNSMAACWNPVP